MLFPRYIICISVDFSFVQSEKHRDESRCGSLKAAPRFYRAKIARTLVCAYLTKRNDSAAGPTTILRISLLVRASTCETKFEL